MDAHIWGLRRIAAITAVSAGALLPAVDSHADSVARDWNETLLASIRKDTPRPPVQTRNLFHASVAMYDAWAAYDPLAKGYFFHEKFAATDIEAARRESISYAAYRLLVHRFAASPNAALIRGYLDARMAALGYSTTVTTTEGNSPAAVGNRIAAQLIARALADGSREAQNYAAVPGTYPNANPPLVVGRPFNPTVVDPSRFQPLALSYTVDASGAVIPGAVQTKLTPFWGSVQPFSLQPSDMNPARPGVYLDPGEPPLLNGAGDAAYRAGHEDVLLRSSWLTPDDGVLIDISPAAMGANTLGADDGAGRPLNPVTGAPYTPNIVKRGDWTRSLAEFWADGPTSSTPPGHWNEIANAVAAHPGFVRRLGGTGPELGPLEWDVKMYLALNGALHDVAVTVWGIKGHYDAMRPIGAIRTLAQYGQSSDPTQPSFHPNGLGLVPGTVEVITAATTAAGERHAALAGFEGQIAVRSWPGVPANPATEHSGVQWMLAGQWLPYQRPNFVTPAFAGYVSGHSTFSRAAADMLTHLSGSPFFPGGVAIYDCEAGNFLVFEDGPSQTLEFQWATYADASDNSGQSRIYGGIHPSFDDYPGRVIGAQVAGKAFARALDLFTPLSEPCRADLDADGTVDASDLALVLVAWGTADARCDFDTNGVVSGEDLATVLIHWGGCR